MINKTQAFGQRFETPIFFPIIFMSYRIVDFHLLHCGKISTYFKLKNILLQYLIQSQRNLFMPLTPWKFTTMEAKPNPLSVLSLETKSYFFIKFNTLTQGTNNFHTLEAQPVFLLMHKSRSSLLSSQRSHRPPLTMSKPR